MLGFPEQSHPAAHRTSLKVPAVSGGTGALRTTAALPSLPQPALLLAAGGTGPAVRRAEGLRKETP